MKRPIAGVGIALVLLVGCASYSGKYAPDCVAFEGTTMIATQEGRFVDTWERVR